MKILTDIIDEITEDAPVTEVTKGVFWTAVISRHCGLSSTMIRDCSFNDGEEIYPEKSYTEMNALELSRYALMPDISRASVGLAAINSVLEPDYKQCVEMNAADFLIKHGKNRNISIIGHFPFVDDLRNIAKSLQVIEKWQRPGDFPEEDAQHYLPLSDIVAMSSTTLINHTLEGLLGLCPEGSIRMLLGPTTPFSAALFRHGIDIISGSRVIDRSLALKHIREGANFRQLKRTGAIRLLTMASNRIREKL